MPGTEVSEAQLIMRTWYLNAGTVVGWMLSCSGVNLFYHVTTLAAILYKCLNPSLLPLDLPVPESLLQVPPLEMSNVLVALPLLEYCLVPILLSLCLSILLQIPLFPFPCVFTSPIPPFLSSPLPASVSLLVLFRAMV